MSSERFVHDLRAPLARAKTYGKLLAEELSREGDAMPLLLQLQAALEDLDMLLKQAESPDKS